MECRNSKNFEMKCKTDGTPKSKKRISGRTTRLKGASPVSECEELYVIASPRNEGAAIHRDTQSVILNWFQDLTDAKYRAKLKQVRC